MAQTFSDIGKAACDLHSKGFPSDNAWKLDVNTRALDGVGFNYSTWRTHQDHIGSSLNAKFAVKEHGLTVDTDVKSSNNIKVELGLANKLYDGVDVKLSHDNHHNTVFKTIYRNSWGGAEVAANIPADRNKSELDVSTALIRDKFSFGVRNVIRVGDQPSFKSLEAAVQYREIDYTAALKFGYNGGNHFKAGGNYIHRLITHNTEVGGYICYDNLREIDQVKLGVAAQFNKAEGSYWKTKLNSDGRAGVAYTSKVTDNTKVTFATEFDALHFGKEGAGKYGLHIVYNN